MEILLTTTSETQKLAEELSKQLKPNDVVALYGDLGSGKTTFTQFLVTALQFSDRVQSPTFILMREYRHSAHPTIKRVFHIDLYRLKTNLDANSIDLDELFARPDAITVIEWPELIKHTLPPHTLSINFDYIDEHTRKAHIHNLY